MKMNCCCCLSVPGGRSQHLVVTHDLELLQLSAALKQADSSQKKLILTSLPSAPVHSSVYNHGNENSLAVCCLKACHVIIFNSSGDEVTADTVKIYDVACDGLSQAYYLLVPSGKIRVVTFVHTLSGDMFLLLISSAGHI